jgi:hypothetical protein
LSGRDNLVASVKVAAVAQIATVIVAVGAAQETINASGVNVGYNLQTGNNPNYVAAIKAAALAKANSLFAAEAARQAAIAVARDTLRATGDLGPV